MTWHEHHHATPVGTLRITGTPDAIRSVTFAKDVPPDPAPAPAPLRDCIRQLDEYFAGKRQRFHLPLTPEGTPFQQRVWRALREIPYGETRAYRDLAETLGDPKAVRAIGLANGRNPHAIVVPCHRVIGADGTLTGYAGGLHRKKWLLAHERKNLAGDWGLVPDRRHAGPAHDPPP